MATKASHRLSEESANEVLPSSIGNISSGFKASCSCHPLGMTTSFVESAEFASAKLPKKHITHESNAQLSTSGSLQFSFGNSQIVEGGGFAHTEAPKSTLSTNLVPICLHLGFPSSPLVSFKWLVELDLH